MSEYIYGTDGHEGHWLTGEEIVRCRDCKHHVDTPKRGCRCYHWMTLDCYENPVPSEVEPNGFCAWGERRDA